MSEEKRNGTTDQYKTDIARLRSRANLVIASMQNAAGVDQESLRVAAEYMTTSLFWLTLATATRE